MSIKIGGWHSNSWFAQMAMKYCGKDYGSEHINAYFFYKSCYGMNASQALTEVNKWKSL